MTTSPAVLITGASRGLGLETARVLAGRGVPVVLACRRPDAGLVQRELGPGAPARAVGLDVGELASVRAFAGSLDAVAPGGVAALVCNAGVQVVSGTRHTAEGLEETFACNHLGHFLLARLLLPRMAAGGRVVFVSSGTHDPREWTGMPAPRPDDIRAIADGTAFAGEPAGAAGRRRYTTSKLFNVLCALELDRRLGASAFAPLGLSSVAFDPGLMPGTGLAREYGPGAQWLWRRLAPVATALLPNVNEVSTSARRLADLATSASHPGASGVYVSRGRIWPSSERSHDRALAARLWQESSALAGVPAALEEGEVT